MLTTLNYIQDGFTSLLYEVYLRVHNWCKRPSKKQDISYYYEMLINACEDGNLPEVKEVFKKCDDLDPDQALVSACEHGRVSIAEWLIDEKGATKLDDCLRISCERNRYPIAELLVQKGADTLIGIRHSSSVNITRMLYRYRQNAEMIHS